MTYHLVCHRHHFFLYQMDGAGLVLLGVERHWEPLITVLLDRRAPKVRILDNGSAHILKIETTSRSLAIHEYIQWCWQKWHHIRQNMLFSMVRPLRRYNGILIAGSPAMPHLMPLFEKLDQCGIASSLYSYPMALILRIHHVHKNQWSASAPPLLVIIDKESHALLAFLVKNRLVFVRHHTVTTSLDNPSVVPKNMIMDTLRYLEKTFGIQGIAPIFFLEDGALEEALRTLFPNAVFHSSLAALNKNEINLPPLEGKEAIKAQNLPQNPTSGGGAGSASSIYGGSGAGGAGAGSVSGSSVSGVSGSAGVGSVGPSAEIARGIMAPISGSSSSSSAASSSAAAGIGSGLQPALSSGGASMTSPMSSLETRPSALQAFAFVFDRLLLPQISRLAIMHLQGGILQRSWVKRLVPYIRLINVLAILISIYSMYAALCLMNCNQKLGQRLDQVHQSFKTIQSELSKMPISSSPILQIQSIRKCSEQQHKKLMQHFSVLEHILNERCLIRMLSISPKKTRLSLQITDPTLIIEDLIDMGQNALPEFRITLAPATHGSIFVVETSSPFAYEKSAH